MSPSRDARALLARSSRVPAAHVIYADRERHTSEQQTPGTSNQGAAQPATDRSERWSVVVRRGRDRKGPSVSAPGWISGKPRERAWWRSPPTWVRAANPRRVGAR